MEHTAVAKANRAHAAQTKPSITEIGHDTRFKSGNRGRPKGSRDKIQHKLITLALADLNKNGAKALEGLRKASPASYFALMTRLLPPERLSDAVASASKGVSISMQFGGNGQEQPKAIDVTPTKESTD